MMDYTTVLRLAEYQMKAAGISSDIDWNFWIDMGGYVSVVTIQDSAMLVTLVINTGETITLKWDKKNCWSRVE